MYAIHLHAKSTSLVVTLDHLAALVLSGDDAPVNAVAYVLDPTRQVVVPEHVTITDPAQLAVTERQIAQVSLHDRVGVNKGAPSRFFRIGDATVNLRLMRYVRAIRREPQPVTEYHVSFVAPIAGPGGVQADHLEIQHPDPDVAARIAAHINGSMS